MVYRVTKTHHNITSYLELNHSNTLEEFKAQLDPDVSISETIAQMEASNLIDFDNWKTIFQTQLELTSESWDADTQSYTWIVDWTDQATFEKYQEYKALTTWTANPQGKCVSNAIEKTDMATTVTKTLI